MNFDEKLYEFWRSIQTFGVIFRIFIWILQKLHAKNGVVMANPISSVHKKHFWFVKVLIELKHLRKTCPTTRFSMLIDANERAQVIELNCRHTNGLSLVLIYIDKLHFIFSICQWHIWYAIKVGKFQHSCNELGEGYKTIPWYLGTTFASFWSAWDFQERFSSF